MEKNILVVDDEKHIVNMLRINLENNGYNVLSAYNGQQALDLLEKEKVDLVLLDVMMPDIDGKVVCKKIKQNEKTKTLPVIMVSAKTRINDKIDGLTYGADDYVTKPFNIKELILRIEASLKQIDLLKNNNESLTRSETDEIIKIGSVTLNLEVSQISSNNITLDLTFVEFKVLKYLMEHYPEIVDKESICNNVLQKDLENGRRILDVHIRNIRKKLEDLNTEKFSIRTIRHIGYIIES